MTSEPQPQQIGSICIVPTGSVVAFVAQDQIVGGRDTDCFVLVSAPVSKENFVRTVREMFTESERITREKLAHGERIILDDSESAESTWQSAMAAELGVTVSETAALGMVCGWLSRKGGSWITVYSADPQGRPKHQTPNHRQLPTDDLDNLIETLWLEYEAMGAPQLSAP